LQLIAGVLDLGEREEVAAAVAGAGPEVAREGEPGLAVAGVVAGGLGGDEGRAKAGVGGGGEEQLGGEEWTEDEPAGVDGGPGAAEGGSPAAQGGGQRQ